jgi:peptidoglycan hydrolase-like protein with peptidoglycan-binding domain
VTSENVILRAQKQLREAGHEAVGDEPGILGSATEVALQAFQRERGLDITGLLDNETLQRLDEAAWTLGSRLLYLVSPHLRGDDVAQLQEALALLGFDPGRIDGIFGIQTQQALQEFQRNCALPVTGELTRTTLGELEHFHLAPPDVKQSSRPATAPTRELWPTEISSFSTEISDSATPPRPSCLERSKFLPSAMNHRATSRVTPPRPKRPWW